MDIKKITSNPMYKYLFLLTIAITIGFQGWRTLFNNFAVDTVGINGLQVGIIQSFREIPGFLALFVVYILLIIKEHRLAAFSTLILGLGVSITGYLPTYYGLIFSTIIMSTGFHYFETTNQSLTLQYFSKAESPHVFGSLRSFSAICNIIVGASIWILSQFLSLQEMFLIIGFTVVLFSLYAFFADPVNKELPVQKKKMVLRKKYWLFYVLNFLTGARRQVFVVFAVFLLVKHYNFSVKAITILFIINNIINFFINPFIARLIIRYGERKILSFEYIALVFIFMAYAFIENQYVAALLYILDHIFFNFYIGLKTYFHKTADPEDIAPSMAVGFTINHISAVIIPIFGGLLWMLNWRIPFIAGAILSFVSIFFARKIRT